MTSPAPTKISEAGRVQELVIPDWHPKTSPNNQKRHWRAVQQNHHHDRDTAWVHAKQASWQFVPGRVRLTITLVYPRKYCVDADNLAARCKGIIDGLKVLQDKTGPYRSWTRAVGFFADDDTEHLDLIVRAEVRRGVKATEITLEALS